MLPHMIHLPAIGDRGQAGAGAERDVVKRFLTLAQRRARKANRDHCHQAVESGNTATRMQW
jgi:hypothetical protein